VLLSIEPNVAGNIFQVRRPATAKDLPTKPSFNIAMVAASLILLIWCITQSALKLSKRVELSLEFLLHP